MYGCNKIYCEHLGRYYSRYYRQLAKDPIKNTDRFQMHSFSGTYQRRYDANRRTSDYGPEMLHSAAKSVPYECFVRKDTRIPFMAMPDAIKALLLIEKAPFENFSQLVYNVTSFSPSAEEIEGYVKNAFPKSEITYEVHHSRQAIVDSWPEDVDDSSRKKRLGLGTRL